MIRIVPCLDLRGGRVVKGLRFEALADAGDPASLAAIYDDEGADEIALLDIGATVEERQTMVASVKAVRDSVAIPIVAGGGIRNLADASRLLDAGADRVSVNSAAVSNPGLIDQLAKRFGTQCVVVAIDARLIQPDMIGTLGQRWEVVVKAGRESTPLDPVAWAVECADRGSGEILLTSIDKDGTGSGYDLELTARVAAACGIPVVASGGARTPEQFVSGARAGARALLGAGVFHRRELKITELKAYMAAQGLEVRI